MPFLNRSFSLFTVAAEQTVISDATNVGDDIAEYARTSLVNLQDFLITVVAPGLLKFVLAIVLYIICRKLISVVINITRKAMEKTKMEKGVESFLLSLIKIGLYGLTIFAIFEIFGIATTTIVAVLGSVGLTIGLALQGSLSNFAGGVLILVLKPYVVEDYIVTCGVEGTVKSIDIFYTTLRTPDNKTIVVPNGTISNSTITNVSHEKQRRLDLTLPVAYGTNIQKVKDILTGIYEADASTLKDKGLTVFLGEFGDSSLNIGFRVWVNSSDFWTTKWRLQETINNAFLENNIEIPFNQLDVHLDK
ncbi:MAG: mechanosensitive ion channel [Lachnospiraceae bacterium]|nr:mechanosensitive ion channel [Lachnospiraceae bacterium]